MRARVCWRPEEVAWDPTIHPSHRFPPVRAPDATQPRKAKSQRRCVRWSPEGDTYLRASYGMVAIGAMAAHLNRTTNAVQTRALEMGLTLGKNRKREWESISEAERRTGRARKSISLWLTKAGILFGAVDGGLVRVRRSDVDAAMARFQRKKGRRVAGAGAEP